MPNALISQITIPVEVSGQVINVTYDIKDAYARQMIAQLGNAIYWMGVTTTALTNGSTTNPITIEGESETADVGGMAQYDGEEFIWNGSAWQSVGKNNFGALAFKSQATTNYTPVGDVSKPTASITGGSTDTVNSITSVGTLPSMTVTSETLVFNPGTLPVKGADQTVVSAVGTIDVSKPTFTGTQATITVS